jgi:hypothetical protein
VQGVCFHDRIPAVNSRNNHSNKRMTSGPTAEKRDSY